MTLDTSWNDLKLGLRMLRRSPLSTVAALLALALGIGATTAIFSVVDGVLLAPLPYPEPDELLAVWEENPAAGYSHVAVSPANLADWREQSRSFAGLAAVRSETFNLTGRGEPEVLTGARVSGDFWRVLGVRPVLGRAFGAAEDAPGRGRVVVLSHGLWQRRFGADPGILGQALVLGGESYTVVGVAPRGFSFPEEHELWVPLALAPDPAHRGQHYLRAVARLREGATLAEARTEMAGLAARLARQHPETNTGWSTALVPLHEDAVGDLRQPLLVLGRMLCRGQRWCRIRRAEPAGHPARHCGLRLERKGDGIHRRRPSRL